MSEELTINQINVIKNRNYRLRKKKEKLINLFKENNITTLDEAIDFLSEQKKRIDKKKE